MKINGKEASSKKIKILLILILLSSFFSHPVNANSVNIENRYTSKDIQPLGLSEEGEKIFNDSFNYVRWIVRDNQQSLSISWKPNMYNYPMEKVFQLLKNIHLGGGDWPETSDSINSMRDQFECHWSHAKGKNPWNIEPWRPYVGYFRTVLAACNPQ